MAVEIRTVRGDELEAFRHCLGLAFSFDPSERDAEHIDRTIEIERSVAAVEDGAIVGTGGAFSLRMTVPGGAVVPTGGTTMISVLPSHRRRGLLTEMMRFHLDDVRRRGEPLAALWASESAIYTRFGFGIGAYRCRAQLERRHAAFTDGDAPKGRVDMLAADTALGPLRAVYDAAAAHRPGMLARSRSWWTDMRLYDPEEWRQGKTAYRFAVYREGEQPLAYAFYRVKESWTEHPANELDIAEVVAATASGHAGIWRYLTGIDLVTDIKAWNLPVDDPLPWLLEHPRRLGRQTIDSLWVRLMDVPEALAARRYRIPGTLVLEVTDAFCPWNDGVYALEGGPDGAECRRTGAAPDLRVPSWALGALYLGGNRWSTLAGAGHVAGDSGSMARADLMFGWDPLPWTGEVF